MTGKELQVFLPWRQAKIKGRPVLASSCFMLSQCPLCMLGVIFCVTFQHFSSYFCIIGHRFIECVKRCKLPPLTLRAGGHSLSTVQLLS